MLRPVQAGSRRAYSVESPGPWVWDEVQAWRPAVVRWSGHPSTCIRKDEKGKGIPVFVGGAYHERRQADDCRAERLVGHSEACHFPNSDMLEGG
jgi:hypothetical protein